MEELTPRISHIDGKPVALNPDGSFRYHFIFPMGSMRYQSLPFRPMVRSRVRRFYASNERPTSGNVSATPAGADTSSRFNFLKRKALPIAPKPSHACGARFSCEAVPALPQGERNVSTYTAELSPNPRAFRRFGLDSRENRYCG